MEQMCLLHNRGILPLQLQPDARVAVIGPLGNENYRDWYTGVSSYAVPILEGLRQQLGAENVLFDDGYSVVALQSVETGKYCTVSADGTLRAAAEQIGERGNLFASRLGFWQHESPCLLQRQVRHRKRHLSGSQRYAL